MNLNMTGSIPFTSLFDPFENRIGPFENRIGLCEIIFDHYENRIGLCVIRFDHYENKIGLCENRIGLCKNRIIDHCIIETINCCDDLHHKLLWRSSS